MATVETFGETFSGDVVEAVLPPGSRTLLLHSREGRKFTTTRKVKRDTRVLVAPKLDGGLSAAIRFPPPSVSFGTPNEFIWSIREFLSERTRLPEETISLLVAFAFSTWFADVFDVSPTLHAFGPESEVSKVLRLLNCCCRRSILLGHAHPTSLAHLPEGLAATLIINERNIGKRLSHVLMASSRRHFGIAHSDGLSGLYGAKLFACDETSTVHGGLEISLSPSLEPLPRFTDVEEKEFAGFFQARFLRFRMLCLETVSDCRVDCTPFPPELREQARSWLAPINDYNELKESVAEELRRRASDIGNARFTDLRCVIAEAALHFCHVEKMDSVLVGEICEAASTLLVARHEQPTISPRRCGAILREFGIEGEREARGFRIELSRPTRERIHRVASAYGVLSSGQIRCSYCGGRPEQPENPNA